MRRLSEAPLDLITLSMNPGSPGDGAVSRSWSTSLVSRPAAAGNGVSYPLIRSNSTPTNKALYPSPTTSVDSPALAHELETVSIVV